MKIASIAEVKANLSVYVKASAAELVVITRNGKSVAVLLPMEDDEELERLALAYSKRFQAILTEGRHQIATTGGISHADFWREVGGEDVGAAAPPAASRHQKLRPNKSTQPTRNKPRADDAEAVNQRCATLISRSVRCHPSATRVHATLMHGIGALPLQAILVFVRSEIGASVRVLKKGGCRLLCSEPWLERNHYEIRHSFWRGGGQ
jgi:prevent-host-death family protein